MTSPRSAEPDFRELFEQAPHPFLVLSADRGFTILAVNDAYLSATMTRRDELLGKCLFDAFPDDPDDPHATGVTNLRASLLRVLHRREPDAMPVQRYAFRRPAALGGGFEMRSWTPHNSPVLSSTGEVRWIIHHVEDATRFTDLLERVPRLGEAEVALVQRDAERNRREVERDRREIERDRRDTARAQVDRVRQAAAEQAGEARDHAEALAAERSLLLAEAVRLAKERERLLTASQKQTAELEAVLQSIPDAVYVGDATGIKRANQPALDLLGYDTVEALNQNIGALVHQIQIRDYATGLPMTAEEQVFTRALGGENARAEVVTRHLKSGKDVVVRSSAAPVRVDGKVVAAVAVNVDITDRVKGEKELQARAGFEKHLIGIVSHDLRSPLAAIITGCETVLLRDDLDERLYKAMSRMLSVAQRASRMTSDLLDFTKVRLGGGLTIKTSPLDLHALVASGVEEVQAAYPDRQVLLEQKGDGQGEWDADRLTQVITNLMRNALAYSPPETPVQVLTEGDGRCVTVRVHNEGPPIPEAKLALVFEPMQRAAIAGAERRNIGLGLFIVRAVVQAHGGSVEAQSSAKEGTTFTVRLPRRMKSPSRPVKP